MTKAILTNDNIELRLVFRDSSQYHHGGKNDNLQGRHGAFYLRTPYHLLVVTDVFISEKNPHKISNTYIKG